MSCQVLTGGGRFAAQLMQSILLQVTFKGTLGEFHNFWQHCTNYIMSI